MNIEAIQHQFNTKNAQNSDVDFFYMRIRFGKRLTQGMKFNK